MYAARTQRTLGSALAPAFLAGTWNQRQLRARGARTLEPVPPWLTPVVRDVLAAYRDAPSDRPRELAGYIASVLAGLPPPDEGWTAAPTVRRRYLASPAITHARWPVRPVATAGELAALLELSPGQLAWLADVQGRERDAAERRLENYTYLWRPRRDGPPRLIERPKRRLKEIQRLVLRDMLGPIPVHDAAHGFVPGRSARSHAAHHTGARVVICFDLEDFFASIAAARVFGVFRAAGYPEGVAHALTGLTTNVTPRREWDLVPRPQAPWRVPVNARLGRRLATPHLPQGAPTSPMLANLCAYGLDRRLAGLATRSRATYSRYADDLTFSGGGALLRSAPEFRALVATIVRDEGFRLNPAKSRLTTRAGRQRVCGIVVNERPNVSREEYDRLRAAVHRFTCETPVDRAEAERRHAHLLGRISWLESLNPGRGAKLRARLAATSPS